VYNKLSSNKEKKMQGEFFKISVSVSGIKKRCRKAERHLLNGGYIPYNDGNYNAEEINDLVKGLVSTNMKEVQNVPTIHLDHVIVKHDEGFRSEQWEPFSKLNKKFLLVSSLENELN
jgi:hypothetical protein